LKGKVYTRKEKRDWLGIDLR